MDNIKSTQSQNTILTEWIGKNLEGMSNKSKFGQVESKKNMEEVARDFESVFVNKLFESMRKAIPKSNLLDSSAMQMYQSLMDQEIAKQMSVQKGMGLGEIVYNDLGRLNEVSRSNSLSSSSLQLPIAPKPNIRVGE